MLYLKGTYYLRDLFFLAEPCLWEEGHKKLSNLSEGSKSFKTWRTTPTWICDLVPDANGKSDPNIFSQMVVSLMVIFIPWDPNPLKQNTSKHTKTWSSLNLLIFLFWVVKTWKLQNFGPTFKLELMLFLIFQEFNVLPSLKIGKK